MKKPTAIQISIPEPCTQAWDDMQPTQGGRHCAHCQKVVVDFTRMTDAQLISFIQKNGLSCGRFRSEQTGIELKMPVVKKQSVIFRCFAALLLLLSTWIKEGKTQNRHSKTRLTHLVPMPTKPLQSVEVNKKLVIPTNLEQTSCVRNEQGLTIGGGKVTVTKYVVEGMIAISPKPMKYNANDKGADSTLPDFPGRKTLRGDDLPHSFRIEDAEPTR